MAFRFRRSIRIAPGFRINFGKRGMSLSAGVRGANITAGKRGIYGNVGVPGTGLSYREKLSGIPTTQKAPKSISETGFQGKAELNLLEDGTVEIRDESGNVLPKKYVRITREQNQEVFDRWLFDKCNKLNSDIETILNIHFNTPPPDEKIAFTAQSFNIPEPTMQPPSPPKPREIGFFDKLLSSRKAKIELQNRLAQANYEKAKQEAEREYQLALEKWQAKKNEFAKTQKHIEYVIEKGRYNDVELMAKFLEDCLENICWPRETLVDFDILHSGKKVMIDVDLPEIEDMPSKFISIAKNGLKLDVRNRTETQTRKDYMLHVHRIGFIIIGETFKALPTVEEIVLSAYSQRLNAATGNISDEYLYSVKVNRPKWSNINFSNLSQIDVSESVGSFEIRRDMTKTGIFKPIEPFEN